MLILQMIVYMLIQAMMYQTMCEALDDWSAKKNQLHIHVIIQELHDKQEWYQDESY
jgi:hypothetical protein